MAAMEPDPDSGASKLWAPSTSSIKGSDGSSQPRSVKRPRPVKSCNECRKRKLKCDRLIPCHQCQKSTRACYYADFENGHDSDASDLESPAPVAKRPHLQMGEGHLRRPSGQAEQPRRSLPRAVSGLDEISARLGRLETFVTEQALPARNHAADQAARQSPPSQPVSGGAPPPRDPGRPDLQTLAGLIAMFGGAAEVMERNPRAASLFELVAALADIHRDLQHEHQKALEPITVFVDSMMPLQMRMADILPPRPVCDQLLELYLVVSDYQMLHVPSFRHEYAEYWEGHGSRDSFLPQLLCVLSIAAPFGTETRGLGHDRTATIHVPTACVLVRDWLDDLRKKHEVDPAALHTELMLIAALRSIGASKHGPWAQMGFVARTALALGLQEDPSEIPTLTEFNRECRRRLWFAIVEMDLRLALVSNFPSVLRQGTFTCRPPSNLDDADLIPDMTALAESKPLDQVTDSHVRAYTARTLPVRVEAATLLTRLGGGLEYNQVLAVGAKLERILDDIKYLFPRHGSLNPANKHKEWRLRVFLDMHVRLTLIAVYRPFVINFVEVPPQMSLSFLKACMTVLTYIDEIDPHHPDHQDVVVMYQFGMRHCIIGAAFSVCWFLKMKASHGAGIPWTPAWNEQDHVLQRIPWSAAAMVEVVERSLDRLIRLTRQGPDSYIQGLVALAIVLNAVQPGTVDEKLYRIDMKLRHMWAVCSQMAQDLQTATPVQAVRPSLSNGKLRKPDFVFGATAPASVLAANGKPPPPQDAATFTWADLLLFWERHAAERESLCGGGAY